MSASGPLVIHILLPLAIQTSPRSSARPDIEPTPSEPAPGSLIASAPFHSPLHSFGRYFARCSSLPLAYRLLTHRLECAPSLRSTQPDARDIRSEARIVRKAVVSTTRHRCSPHTSKQNKIKK